jgi:hypothetical protein
MRILKGLKLSEVVRLFEEGKAVGCRPQSQIDKFDSFYILENWNAGQYLNDKWDVQLREEKVEITLEQLEKAWYEKLNPYMEQENSYYHFKLFKKELGFE